jgi:mRNA-degrading endonuclease toxin of MazEF toxin-antitoxin module
VTPPEFPARGFIYKVTFPDVVQKKTALVVSLDILGEFLKPVVVQVTGTNRIRTIIDTVVQLRAGEAGLTENSYALCHEIWTLGPDLFDPEPLGQALDPLRMAQVDAALGFALDLRTA